MTPQQCRALYQKRKKETQKRKIGIAVRQANADARARRYIERWLAGETHQQIADSEGIRQSSVTKAITNYRKRHPDTPIPSGPQRQGETV